MAIDWTTFFLEIINFLVLVWILKRFLYQPVLSILSQRQMAIERSIAEARLLEARASELETQYGARLAAWEREKAAARAQLQLELAEERTRRLTELERELATERQRLETIEARRSAEERQQLERQAIGQARRFIEAVFREIAAPRVELDLLDRLLAEWQRLPEATMAELRSSLRTPGTRISVTSAFPLPADARERLTQALAERLGREILLEFEVNPDLLAGLRLSLGAWRLHLNLADEVADFVAAADHAA